MFFWIVADAAMVCGRGLWDEAGYLIAFETNGSSAPGEAESLAGNRSCM
jgi:hypothetical protein